MSFWLIGYGELLWDRTVTAFVPMAVIKTGGVLYHILLDRFMFLDEAECDEQVRELEALGCSYLKKKAYAMVRL